MKNLDQPNTIVEVKGIRTIQVMNHSTEKDTTAIEVAEMKSEKSNEERTYVVIVITPSSSQSKSHWISHLSKMTGWKCSLFEPLNNDDPLFFIDINRRRVFIRKDLLKLPVRQFVRLIKHLIEFIAKSSTSTYQKLQNEVRKISNHLKSSLSRDYHITVKITDNRLILPSSLELSAEDYYVDLIAYDNTLILRSAKYNLSTMVDTIFPLTAIEVVINFDGMNLGFQLPKGIRDALGVNNHSIQFKLKKLEV